MANSEFLRREQTGEPVLQLLAHHPEAVLLGEAGGGKTAVAQAWAHQLEAAISPVPSEGLERPWLSPRLPVDVRAPDIERRLGKRELNDPQVIADLIAVPLVELVLGTHYVIVDAFNELPREGKDRVAAWILALRREFGRTPVLVCQRTRDRVASELPGFTELVLQDLSGSQPRDFIDRYFGQGTPHAQLLKSLLLDDQERTQLQSLARKPLFLKMLCEYFSEKKQLPSSRGQLFKDFSRAFIDERWRQDPTHPEPVHRQDRL